MWLSRLVLACKLKGHWFHSQTGHMPGLWARSPVEGRARGNHTLMFISLSFSFSSSLSKNTLKNLKKEQQDEASHHCCLPTCPHSPLPGCMGRGLGGRGKGGLPRTQATCVARGWDLTMGEGLLSLPLARGVQPFGVSGPHWKKKFSWATH